MARVLIIGIDGATWDLLDPMLKLGRMPNLASVIAQGARGDMLSTEPPVTPVAWASFQTGVRPEVHGIYGFRNISFVDGEIKIEATDSSTIRVKTIWEYVSEYGKKVAVISCPMTYPPFQVNGFLIPGFPSPSPNRPVTYPSELGEELARKGLEWIVPSERTKVLPKVDFTDTRGLSQAIAFLNQKMNVRLHTAYELLEKHSWDLAMFQFQEPDWVQHAFWPELEAGPERGGGRYEAVLSFYQAVDEGLGELLQLIGEDDFVVIVSDHGFQGSTKEVYLNRWLKRGGFLKYKVGVRRRVLAMLINLYRRVDRDRRLVAALSREKRAQLVGRVERSNLDWDRSIAYMSADGSSGTAALFLTPAGVRFSKEVISHLKALTDPDIGELVVEEVLPIEAAKDKKSPYAWVRLKDGYAAVTAHEGDDLFRRRMRGKDYQLGIHHRKGMMVLVGPEVRKGHKLELPLDIIDIAPMVVYLLGIPIPSFMQGRLIEEAFSCEYLGGHPVTKVHDEGRKEGTFVSPGLTPEEEAIITKQLEDLGYLE